MGKGWEADIENSVNDLCNSLIFWLVSQPHVCHPDVVDAGFNYLRRKALLLFGGGSALALLVAVAFFGREPPSPALIVGTYESECCGSLRVDERSIFVNEKAVSYEIGMDNQGLFLLPGEPIGMIEGCLGVYQAGNLLKLRLDHPEEPTTLLANDLNTYEAVEFVRR